MSSRWLHPLQTVVFGVFLVAAALVVFESGWLECPFFNPLTKLPQNAAPTEKGSALQASHISAKALVRPSTFTSMAASSTPRRRGTRRCIGPTCPPPSYRNRTFRCGSDGIITIKSGGRLGNQMGEHATLLALAWRDQLFPILQHRTATTLDKYFSHISVASVMELQCPLNWTYLNLREYNNLEPRRRQALALGGVFIDGYPTSVSLFHRHRRRISDEFRFKPAIADAARRKLRQLVGPRRSAVRVGVHVRRTDYREFLKQHINASLIGAVYLERAMKEFRQQFASKGGVVFVVASDDLAWCRANVRSVADDVVYAGDGDGDAFNPALDMALLAACNHSIITYGNFGFWSAYLAGGQTLLAGNLSETPTELMLTIRKASIDGWRFLPGL